MPAGRCPAKYRPCQIIRWGDTCRSVGFGCAKNKCAVPTPLLSLIGFPGFVPVAACTCTAYRNRLCQVTVVHAYLSHISCPVTGLVALGWIPFS